MSWDICEKCHRKIEGTFCECDTGKLKNVDWALELMELRRILNEE